MLAGIIRGFKYNLKLVGKSYPRVWARDYPRLSATGIHIWFYGHPLSGSCCRTIGYCQGHRRISVKKHSCLFIHVGSQIVRKPQRYIEWNSLCTCSVRFWFMFWVSTSFREAAFFPCTCLRNLNGICRSHFVLRVACSGDKIKGCCYTIAVSPPSKFNVHCYFKTSENPWNNHHKNAKKTSKSYKSYKRT